MASLIKRNRLLPFSSQS